MTNPISQMHSYLDQTENRLRQPDSLPPIAADTIMQIARFKKLQTRVQEISLLQKNLQSLSTCTQQTIASLSLDLTAQAEVLEGKLKIAAEGEPSWAKWGLELITSPLTSLSSEKFPYLTEELKKCPSSQNTATPEVQQRESTLLFEAVQDTFIDCIEKKFSAPLSDSNLQSQVAHYKALTATAKIVREVSERALKLSSKAQSLSNTLSEQLQNEGIELNTRLQKEQGKEPSLLDWVWGAVTDPYCTNLPYLKKALTEQELVSIPSHSRPKMRPKKLILFVQSNATHYDKKTR